MNEQNYTSPDLSKKLDESLMLSHVETDMEWIDIGRCYRDRKEIWQLQQTSSKMWTLPAYDILNDLCVKYAKEMFGEVKAFYREGNSPVTRTEAILNLLQQGKKQEAEDYIWTHCLFNPKNK